ncbi:uncharacterized protein RJT21DRAFT_19655 [Scheffersomyces amazonensis]|uniref:uncharacterized protein n=1 Tax=Scheffersomyces amazonensis TaxID=1078765 RepID=UPI00315C82A9
MAPSIPNKKAASPTPVPSSSSSQSLSKSIRNLTFKARFKHHYGSNNEKYESIVKYRTATEHYMFYIDEKDIAEQIKEKVLIPKELITINIKDLGIPDPKLKGIDKNQIQSTFQQELVLNLKKNSSTTMQALKITQPFSLSDSVSRRGYLINAGGNITSSSWLQRPLDDTINEHYLAVSVIYNQEGIEKTINSEELTLFPNIRDEKHTIKSGIQIWKYNLDNDKIELIKFYVTTDIGATNNLKWLPIHIKGDKKSLGILVGNFTDGRIHLLKVSSGGPQFAEINEPSLTYSIPPTAGLESSITCFDFVGHNKILVGLSEGSLAEFVLPYYDLKSPENSFQIPSFISRVANTAISSIMVAEVESNRSVVIVNSLGVQTLAFEYSNFIQGLALPLFTRSSVVPSYNPNLKIYLWTPNPDTTGFNFIRNPEEGANILMKIDSFVTALKVSERIGHPLSLTGSAGGDLFVVNYTRKFLNGGKTSSKTTKVLKLWKLRFKESLEVDADYVLMPNEVNSQFPVEPPQTVISTIDWNENLLGSSLYSAGTLSGLLIVERLDPKA